MQATIAGPVTLAANAVGRIEGGVFAQTYDDARYDDLVNYSALLDLPLAPEDLAWSADQAREFAERSGKGH
jgi:hypothetical protein